MSERLVSVNVQSIVILSSGSSGIKRYTRKASPVSSTKFILYRGGGGRGGYVYIFDQYPLHYSNLFTGFAIRILHRHKPLVGS